MGLYSRMIVATTEKYNLASNIELTDEPNNSWHFVTENMTSELTIPRNKYYFLSMFSYAFRDK